MAKRSDVLKLRIEVDGTEANQEIDKFTGKVKKAGDKVKNSSKKITRSFKDIRNAATAIGVSIVAAGYTIDKVMERAGKVSNLSQAFETLTARVGSTADKFLNSMRPAARGLVTDMELMQQANNAILLGLPVTADSMGRLTDMAIKLGRAMGQDAATSIESLIVGIGRQSKLWLDNLGIIINTEQAYKNYAATLGVTASELTDAQKKLAFFKATVGAAEVAVDGLEDSAGRLSDAWEAAKTAVVNAGDEILYALDNAIGKERISYAIGVQLEYEGYSPEELRKVIEAGVNDQFANVAAAKAHLAARKKLEASGPDLAPTAMTQELAMSVGIPEGVTDGYEHLLTNMAKVFDFLERFAQAPPVAEAVDLTTTVSASTLAALDDEYDEYVARQMEMIETRHTLEQEAEANLLDLRIGYAEEWSLKQEELQQEEAEKYYDARITAMDAVEGDTTALKDAAERERNEIHKRYAAARTRIEAKQAQSTIAIQQMVVGAMLSAAGQVFGASKAFAIAETIIRTWMGVMSAMAMYPPNIPLAGAVKAMGAISVAGILATSVKGGGGVGGGSIGGGSYSGGGGSTEGRSILPTPDTVAPKANEVHIWIEGQGFIQDTTEFARTLSDEITGQMDRSGA